jgi:hypothetical protein
MNGMQKIKLYKQQYARRDDLFFAFIHKKRPIIATGYFLLIFYESIISKYIVFSRSQIFVLFSFVCNKKQTITKWSLFIISNFWDHFPFIYHHHHHNRNIVVSNNREQQRNIYNRHNIYELFVFIATTTTINTS